MLFKTKPSRTSPETTGEENTGQEPELGLVDLFSVGWDLEQKMSWVWGLVVLSVCPAGLLLLPSCGVGARLQGADGGSSSSLPDRYGACRDRRRVAGGFSCCRAPSGRF